MKLPYSPNREIMDGFKAFLIKKHGEELGNSLYSHLTSDKGFVVVAHDEITHENHLICFFGSMRFGEVYKIESPSQFVLIKNNNEDLKRKINIPGH